MPIPLEECADVSMKANRLAGHFVGDPMQFSDLVKERLELFLFDVRKVRPPDSPLKQSLARAPLLLLKQHPAQLRESGGRVIEGAQDCLTILNRETDDPLLGFECDHECLRRVVEAGVVEQPSEVEHIFVSHSTAGDIHRGEATQ